jgi:hypothetical protein
VLFIVIIYWRSILCSSENDVDKKIAETLPGKFRLLRLKLGSDGNKIRIFLYESFVAVIILE